MLNKDNLNNQFAQLLMDSNPQYIFWKDRDGVYLGCNKLYAYFCDLKSTDDIIGKSDFDFMDADEAKICIAADKEVMDNGDALLNFEEFVTNAHGESLWYNINKIPLKNDEDQIIGVLGTMTDVTEKKSQNNLIKEQQLDLALKFKELEVKNKELEEFNYIVAHDLQEPIRNILNFSELIKSKKEFNAEYLEYISNSATRMSDLLNALLSFSVLGTKNKTKSKFKLEDIVYQVENILKTSKPEQQFVICFDENSISLEGYKEELVSLFQNLISNSIKYSKKGQKAEIKIYEEENGNNEKKRIVVEDNGQGFDIKHKSKVLKMFQRLHHNEDIAGLGLGLPICAKIMKMHDGSLDIESELDHGTKVYLNF